MHTNKKYGVWIGIRSTMGGLVLSEWKESQKQRLLEKVRVYEDSVKNV